MTSLLVQSMRDRVLWMLADSDGNMERSSLRRRIGWKYSILDPVLEELEKEGRIKIDLPLWPFCSLVLWLLEFVALRSWDPLYHLPLSSSSL